MENDAVAAAVAISFPQLLLELVEEGLVLLVQELRLLPQPLVLPDDVAVLQVQLRVDLFHRFLLYVSLSFPENISTVIYLLAWLNIATQKEVFNKLRAQGS